MYTTQNQTVDKNKQSSLFTCNEAQKTCSIGMRGYALMPLLGLILMMSACTLGQQWSQNYAVMPGVKSNVPVIIDGNLETVGQSQEKKSSGDLVVDMKLPSEAIIYLPDKKRLFRIVIYSSNLQDFQLMALDSMGEWDKIHEQRSNKEPIIDIRLKRSVTTNGVKLVVRKTTDDAARKRKNLKLERENEVTADGKVRRGRQVYKLYGSLKAPAKIAEMELYGYAKATP
ncbi:MAG: hypothetical protein OXI67_03165 [Candidatus Poribacteria bacterium]|nr:hypothetical protein [Candidatus Poribacteria bacterium]